MNVKQQKFQGCKKLGKEPTVNTVLEHIIKALKGQITDVHFTQTFQKSSEKIYNNLEILKKVLHKSSKISEKNLIKNSSKDLLRKMTQIVKNSIKIQNLGKVALGKLQMTKKQSCTWYFHAKIATKSPVIQLIQTKLV